MTSREPITRDYDPLRRRMMFQYGDDPEARLLVDDEEMYTLGATEIREKVHSWIKSVEEYREQAAKESTWIEHAMAQNGG